ncbi:hypothetical protein QBC39DRAFT_354449 [Podospora conica]|nr:hypothetical protein QBC39DRAFT_354449 [Schizothecium conicum]
MAITPQNIIEPQYMLAVSFVHYLLQCTLWSLFCATCTCPLNHPQLRPPTSTSTSATRKAQPNKNKRVHIHLIKEISKTLRSSPNTNLEKALSTSQQPSSRQPGTSQMLSDKPKAPRSPTPPMMSTTIDTKPSPFSLTPTTTTHLPHVPPSLNTQPRPGGTLFVSLTALRRLPVPLSLGLALPDLQINTSQTESSGGGPAST